MKNLYNQSFFVYLLWVFLTENPMKVVVVRDLCIGAAPCVAIAGSVFQLDEEGKAIIIDEHGTDDETMKLAAESCPTRAIILTDETTGVQIYPPEA